MENSKQYDMNINQLYEIFKQHSIISIDSRNCPVNSIFFALKGDRFDGNNYIKQALDNGAAYAIGDKSNLQDDNRIIQTDNTLRTLQELANYHRKQMKAIVIAITGTNGKTTTKELIAAVLSSQYEILYTQGNLNNHIGVPLTLLQLQHHHKFAIIEIGANHPGEIHALCQIAEPDFGLITNVGKAHLEGFGSFKGVVYTKIELYNFLLEHRGIAFCNLDNSILTDLSHSLPTVYYGTTSDTLVHGRITRTTPTLSLEWNGGTLITQLAGSYNFENIMAALCIGEYFGVKKDKMNAAIENYIPTNNRSQNINTGYNHLIVDAYNANPSSMQAALNNFSTLDVSPKMVILGEMKELGKYSKTEHQRLVNRLPQTIEKVLLVGKNFIPCISSLSLPSYQLFPTTEVLIDYLQTTPIRGYHILIKGSRSNQLENIIFYL